MPNVLAYILNDPEPAFDRRKKAMCDYAAKQLPGLPFYVFWDFASDGSKPLRRRPAGYQLTIQWWPDDHLIFDSSLAIGSARDFRNFLVWTRDLRLTVHLVDLKFVSSDKRSLELAINVLDSVLKRRSITSKESHRRCRENGVASNQHCKPGYRMVRRAGGLVREPDEDEWRDIQRIVGLRKDGLSWQQTSDSMFELECCRAAVNVWEAVAAQRSGSGE